MSNCIYNCSSRGGAYITLPVAYYELYTTNLKNLASSISSQSVVLFSSSDVCIGLRLQQVMKSQWQTKSLERSKPLKKLSLKHKLSSSKEKHKFTNSLMAVSEYKCPQVIKPLNTVWKSSNVCEMSKIGFKTGYVYTLTGHFISDTCSAGFNLQQLCVAVVSTRTKL